MTLDELLDRAQNFLGPIDKAERKRLWNFFRNPTIANWDNIHRIILRWPGLGTAPRTVGQAVSALDARYSTTNRRQSMKADFRWSNAPNVFLVHRAIRTLLLAVPDRTWTAKDFVPLSVEAMRRVRDAEAEKHL